MTTVIRRNQTTKVQTAKLAASEVAAEGKPALFQDAMDRSRILSPISVNGSKTLCRVYFRGAKGSLNFAGKVEISSHLFGNQFVGFMPYVEGKDVSEDKDAAKTRRFVRSEKKEQMLTKKSNDHIVNGS